MLVSFASGIGDQESAKIFHDAAFSGASDLPDAGKQRAAEHAVWYLRSRLSNPAVRREYCKVLRALIEGIMVAIGEDAEAVAAADAAAAADKGKRRRGRIVAWLRTGLEPEIQMGIAAAPKGARLSSALPLHYLFQAEEDLREELANEEKQTKKR
jgi:hypothetical protein